MSKKVKSMIMRDYKARIGDASEAAVISLRGVKGIATTNMRRELHKKKIKITVVQNNLFRKTMEGSPLSKLEPYLKGATAIATGGSDAGSETLSATWRGTSLDSSEPTLLHHVRRLVPAGPWLVPPSVAR